MSLRHVLYYHINLDERYPLITEVHQDSELDIVDIVVPEIPEAEAMVAMMNKQLLVYLSNYFIDASMGKVFVNEVTQGEICAALNHAAGTCTWDSSKKTSTTKEDAELERQKLLKDAAWYEDECGDRMSTKGLQKKKEYSSPDMLYDIDIEHSVKTIHEHPGEGYAGTTSTDTIDLNIILKYKEDVVGDESPK